MKVRQEVFDTYWYFAAERQNIFFKRLSGEKAPWSSDPILQEYKFCNTYRASDRVSQFLIKDVICKNINELSAEDLLLRIFFFRLLNKIETWKSLENKFGTLTLKNFDRNNISKFLSDEMESGAKIYGNAFILCATKAFGFDKKHDNHLALIESLFKNKTSSRLLNSKSLEELFNNLKELPLIGDFMAYQIAIDLNYSTLFDFNENDFTIAGPGAVRGIKKMFPNANKNEYRSKIMFMVENQDSEFERLGIKFKDLFGRKLQTIDCQNLFCETDKYCRVKYPELKSNRSRIKAKYEAKSIENDSSRKLEKPFYPPKWNINVNIDKYFENIKQI